MMLLSFLPPLGLHPLTPLLPLLPLPLLLPLPSRSAGREPQHFNQPLCGRDGAAAAGEAAAAAGQKVEAR